MPSDPLRLRGDKGIPMGLPGASSTILVALRVVSAATDQPETPPG